MAKREKRWPPDHAGRLAQDLMHVAYERFNPTGPGIALGLTMRGADLQKPDRARFTFIVQAPDGVRGQVTYFECVIRRRELRPTNGLNAEQLALVREA